MPETTPPTTVRGCARCGGIHEDVVFEALKYPIAMPGHPFTHWAPCPTNGQPIVMRFVEIDAVTASTPVRAQPTDAQEG